MKVLLDQLGMDRPTNEELKKLGAKLNKQNAIIFMVHLICK
jgi:hypothetical protein